MDVLKKKNSPVCWTMQFKGKRRCIFTCANEEEVVQYKVCVSEMFEKHMDPHIGSFQFFCAFFIYLVGLKGFKGNEL